MVTHKHVGADRLLLALDLPARSRPWKTSRTWSQTPENPELHPQMKPSLPYSTWTVPVYCRSCISTFTPLEIPSIRTIRRLRRGNRTRIFLRVSDTDHAALISDIVHTLLIMKHKVVSSKKIARSMKEDNLAYDLKHLTATDITPINDSADIKQISTSNVQLLVSQIFQLPREQTDSGPIVRLDKLEFVEQMPRKMPLPKPKVKSRWDIFAEERGISKKKRSRLVWDEAAKDWVPRWGANSAKHRADKQNWLVEVPLISSQDPFEQKRVSDQLVKAKQKLREARNKVEMSGDKLPAGVNSSLVEGKKRGKETLDEVLKRAQVSSGSSGKFDRRIQNEKVLDQGKKKKLLSSKAGQEKSQALKIMNSVLKGTSAGSTDRKVVQISQAKAMRSKNDIRKMKQTNRKKVR